MSTVRFWTAERAALLGTDSDAVIAERLGVSIAAVEAQRKQRHIPVYGNGGCRWGQTDLGLLRSYSDEEIAKITRRSLREIAAKRREMSK